MATTPAYFLNNPDVANAYKVNTYGLTPQEFADTHFALYGGGEQRAAPPIVEAITSGNLSTLPAYFKQNQDVSQGYLKNTYGLTPEDFAAAHYAKFGGPLEQRASPTVVTAITSGDLSSLPKYFQDNPDVATSYLNNTYGLTPQEFADTHYTKFGQYEQRISPTGAPAIIPPATTTTTAVPVGQFRELFPAFSESKRLAGEMVANRPSMESIISMLQGQGQQTPATVAGQATPSLSNVLNTISR
jgi:hypothetical protein